MPLSLKKYKHTKRKKISQIQNTGNDKAKCQSEGGYPLRKIKRKEVKHEWIY